MKRIIDYIIEKNNDSYTIADFLRNKGYSAKLLSLLRRSEGGITIAGEAVYTTRMLSVGDRLRITMEETGSENIVPTPMNLAIIYEDPDLLVIDKPAGLPVHPSQGNYEQTLANGIACYFKEKGESMVFRAVNRLDRDTTGLILIAKNRLSSAILSNAIKQRKIEREYLAVVAGTPPESGSINAPIARLDGSVIERCVDYEKGESAVTHYKRLETKNGFSLLEVRLETGRTHQIRVHMSHLGYPLLGDFLYHPDFSQIGRQSLHSYRLTFYHPVTEEELKFQSPLPEDMKNLLI